MSARSGQDFHGSDLAIRSVQVQLMRHEIAGYVCLVSRKKADADRAVSIDDERSDGEDESKNGEGPRKQSDTLLHTGIRILAVRTRLS